MGMNLFVINGLDDGTFDKKTISPISTSVLDIQYICVGDLNNDHWIDIVTANWYNDSVGVLLGSGNGAFRPMTTYSTGTGSLPNWVALGDMNNDGRLDIVSANYGSNSIGILLGNGDGIFATVVSCLTDNQYHLTSVALADIDNDHRLDIVVLDEVGFIYILHGYNHGICTLLTKFRIVATGFSVLLADFNRDDNLDLVVTDPLTGNISVSLGSGDGTFARQTLYQIGSHAAPYNVIIADFNNDNVSDLAATDFNNDAVVILYGDGDGSFTLARKYFTGFSSKPYNIGVAYFNQNKQLKIVVTLWDTKEIAVLTEYTAAEFVNQAICSTGSTPQPFSVAVGHFNHDNRSDIVVANSGTDSLGVLLVSGNGTFDRNITYPNGADSQPQYVITCDVNQDQQLDIVSVNSKANSITVMMGESDGTFVNQTMYSTGNNSHPSAVTSGDWNNDGRLDLVTANEGTDSIGVFFGFNYTTFQSSVLYSGADSLQPFGIVVSDFNNDGFQDVASAFAGSGKIGIFLGCGNGSFTLPTIYPVGNAGRPYAIAVSDLNNDDRMDIIFSDAGTHQIGILLGYGNGSFATIRKYSAGGLIPISVAVKDVNNDNRADIVVANIQSGTVGVLLGYGNGIFSSVMLYSTGQESRPRFLTLYDFDRNGQLDIIVVNSATGIVGVLLGIGDGTFRNQEVWIQHPASTPNGITVGDFNNDSILDFVIVEGDSDSVFVILRSATNTSNHVRSFSTGSGSLPVFLDVGDFNNDNALDIAVVNSGTNSIVILFGIGDGNFHLGRAHSTGIGSEPGALAIGDFNNDTRLDIVVTNFYVNNIVIFLGGDNEPFADITSFNTGDGSRPHSVAVGDVNNDDQMDIVVPNYGTDNIGVLLGRSDREFTTMETYSTGTGSYPYCVALADLNNDTYSDIVVTTSETDSIVILFGDGNGIFITSARYSTGCRSRPYTLVISDFNNDHIWDIAVANSGTSRSLSNLWIWKWNIWK